MSYCVPTGPGGIEGGRIKFLKGVEVVDRVLLGQLELE